jgi:hypothetical protein
MAKKTQYFIFTKISEMMLLKVVIPVYTDHHTKYINTLYGQNVELLIIKLGGIYSYHCSVRDKGH